MAILAVELRLWVQGAYPEHQCNYDCSICYCVDEHACLGTVAIFGKIPVTVGEFAAPYVTIIHGIVYWSKTRHNTCSSWVEQRCYMAHTKDRSFATNNAMLFRFETPQKSIFAHNCHWWCSRCRWVSNCRSELPPLLLHLETCDSSFLLQWKSSDQHTMRRRIKTTKCKTFSVLTWAHSTAARSWLMFW